MEDIEYKDYDYIRIRGVITNAEGVIDRGDLDRITDALIETVESCGFVASLSIDGFNEGEE